MKLTLVNSDPITLNEVTPFGATLDRRGLLGKITQEIKQPIEALGYSVKSIGESLCILPSSDHILQIQMQYDESTSSFTAHYWDCNNNELSADVCDKVGLEMKDPKLDAIADAISNLSDLSAIEDDTALMDDIEQYAINLKASIDNYLAFTYVLADKLDETNPFQAIAQAIGDRRERADRKAIFKTLAKYLTKAIIAILGKQSEFDYKVDIQNNTIDISLISKVKNSAVYTIVTKAAEDNASDITVAQFIDVKNHTTTPADMSLNTLLTKIANKFNIRLNVSDGSKSRSGSSDYELAADKNYRSRLINDLSPQVAKFFESLSEDVSAEEAGKYIDAYDAGSEYEKATVTKLFLHDEYGIEDTVFDDIEIVKAMGKLLRKANFNTDNCPTVDYICTKMVKVPNFGKIKPIQFNVTQKWVDTYKLGNGIKSVEVLRYPEFWAAGYTADEALQIARLYSSPKVNGLTIEALKNNIAAPREIKVVDPETGKESVELEKITPENTYTKIDELKAKHPDIEPWLRDDTTLFQYIFRNSSDKFRPYADIIKILHELKAKTKRPDPEADTSDDSTGLESSSEKIIDTRDDTAKTSIDKKSKDKKKSDSSTTLFGDNLEDMVQRRQDDPEYRPTTDELEAAIIDWLNNSADDYADPLGKLSDMFTVFRDID